MKKIISILSAIAMLLSFAACGKTDGEEAGNWLFSQDGEEAESASEGETGGSNDPEAPKETTTYKAAVTKPENVFSFAKYDSGKKVYKRLSEGKLNKFTPGAKYGAVIPFIADYKTVTTETGYSYSTVKYGLMTTDGTIVLDAIYDGINKVNLNGVEMLELYADSEAKVSYSKRLFVTLDGAKAIEAPEPLCETEDKDVLLCMDAGGGAVYGAYNSGGKLIVKFPQSNGYVEYSNGVFSYVYGDEDFDSYQRQKVNAIAYDKSGKKLFELPNYYLEAFHNGYAIVKQINPESDYTDETSAYRNYGFVDKSGQFKIQPEYEMIYPIENGKYYLVKVNGRGYIWNSKLEQVAEVLAEYSECYPWSIHVHNGKFTVDVDTDNGGWEKKDIVNGGVVAKGTYNTVDDISEHSQTDNGFWYSEVEKNGKTTKTFYDAADKQKLFELTYDSADAYVHIDEESVSDRFLLVYEQTSNKANNRLSLFDIKNKKFSSLNLDDCLDVCVSDAKGKTYFSLVYKTHICVLDESFKPIMYTASK